MPRSGTNRPDSDSRFHAPEPCRRYSTTLLSRIFRNVSFPNTPSTHSTCITYRPRPRPTSPSSLSHTDCTRQEGLECVPCLEDHPALPYRVPTTPVLWLFFLGAHTRVHRLYHHHLPIGRTRSSASSPDFRWHIRACELLE
jgi:hypothetical protein